MTIRTTLTLAVTLAATTSVTHAATRYVSPGQSIQQAIDASADGDSIIIRPGTYDGALNLRGKAISLIGEAGPDETIITSSAPQTSVITIDSDESWDTVIDGLTVTGGTGTTAGYQTIGGGFKIFGANPTIRNCIIRDNRAGGGGGMYLLAAYPRISKCVFENNVATATGDNGGGGGVHSSSCSPQFANCTFINNSTTGTSRGGGMRMHSGYAVYANCLFVGNEAYIGGAADVNHGRPSFVNCTFTRNAARGYTAVVHSMYSDALVTLSGSIIWDNDSPYGYPLYNTGGAQFAITFSNVAGGWDGQGNMDVDPKFRDASNGDFRLAEDSPCVDRGDSLALPHDFADLDDDGDIYEPTPVDKDNAARLAGAQVDMGAFEVHDPVVDPVGCPSDVNGDELVDVHDLLNLLAAWGLCDGCPGDSDDNGVIDVFDLIHLLDTWGDCPA